MLFHVTSHGSETANAGRAAPTRLEIRRLVRAPLIQPKLTIGAANDQYEQEADRVADELMRWPGAGGQVAGAVEPHLQRQEEEEEELLQTKRDGNAAFDVAPATQAAVRSLRGGGRMMSGSERSFYEPRFQVDFANVRIHSDSRAAGIARSINARAFTLGNDVVFGAGQYSDNSSSGRRLLAHELTHVVQQNGGTMRAQRSTAAGVAPSADQHATLNPPPQVHSMAGAEDEERVQRDNGGGNAPAPAQQAPSSATPTLNFGKLGTTLTRGDTLTATVHFTANSGEAMNVTQWRFVTTGHGTVTRPAGQAAFQSSWSGEMAVSGRLEMQYTITPSGGKTGAAQTLTQAVTVNDRTGANWQSAVTNAGEGALSGQPSPPRLFIHLGRHNGARAQPKPTTKKIANGPNHKFSFVSAIGAGTYTSTPSVHPDLTAAQSRFKTFHSQPSLLFLVSGATRTRIPNAQYSNLSTTGNSLTFTVTQWEAFYKRHNFYRVQATGNGRTIRVRDAWWALVSNAQNADVDIANDAEVRKALGAGGAPYNGGYKFSATSKSWSGFVLMQAANILTGTRSHEFSHATHSHRANFVKIVRALDPRKVLEKKVSAPGHAFDFNNGLTTLLSEIGKPNHEIVDEAASARDEKFVAQAGVTMAGINSDPANGNFLGTVWDISGNKSMT